MKTRAKRFVSALLAGVLCLSLLAGCASKKKELTRYSTVFYDVFDTVTQVIAYCESEEEFNTQMDALHADLITYNQLYDIYNDYPGVTNVKTINDNAGSAPVEVDDRILSMLELADQMYQTTNGKLNIDYALLEYGGAGRHCDENLAQLPRSCRSRRDGCRQQAAHHGRAGSSRPAL